MIKPNHNNNFHKMCNHQICKHFVESGIGKGIAILPLLYYSSKTNKFWAGLLGKEKYGKYAGQMNLCAGKMEKEDSNCWLATASRELYEEFKIHLSISQFQGIFTKWILIGRTPVFFGEFKGLRKTPLNNAIQSANSNPLLPHCHKEMEKVGWVNVATKEMVDNSRIQISTFARSVLGNLPRIFFYN